MQWKIEPFSSIHQPIFSKHFHTYSFYNCLFTLHFHSTVEWKKRVHSKSYLEQDLSRTVPIRLFVYYLLCTKLSRNVIRSLSLLPKKKNSIRNSCSNLQMKTINLLDLIFKPIINFIDLLDLFFTLVALAVSLKGSLHVWIVKHELWTWKFILAWPLWQYG